MAEQEDQYRETPLPLRDAPTPPEPGVLPVNYSVRTADSVPPATDSVSFKVGSPSASGSELDAPPEPTQLPPSIPRTPISPELLALTSKRPVEALLRDPLGEVLARNDGASSGSVLLRFCSDGLGLSQRRSRTLDSSSERQTTLPYCRCSLRSYSTT